MLLKDYINYLQDNYSPETHIINCLWLDDDVISVIEERFPEHTYLLDKIPEIIETIEHRMDANVGINWGYIEDIITLNYIQEDEDKG